MDDLLAIAAANSIRYLRGRDERSVFPDEAALDGLQNFVEPLPTMGCDPIEVLSLLSDSGGPATVATTGGRYFGFVNGASYPVGLAASWQVSAWDQNTAMAAMSPTAAVLDTLAGNWLGAIFGLPERTQHTFTSGTSSANSICLAAARDKLLADAGWDSVSKGLAGSPELRVVVGASAHSSVTKALGFIGLGRDNVVVVPTDDQGCLIAGELPEPGVPTIVILQAGNVNTGAFDPYDAVADHFEGSPHWIHVDGAFGMWAAASPSKQHLTEGYDRAHSWAVDMHKWLNTTYDSACAFVRVGTDLARTFYVGADYLPDGGGFDPVHRGIDMSQRARAVETWAVLKTLGRMGVADMIEGCCEHAERFAAAMTNLGFEVLNDVVLNQVLVSFGDDARTDTVIELIEADGTIWAGGSKWAGRSVMRFSVSSWATTAKDIDAAIDTITRLTTAQN